MAAYLPEPSPARITLPIRADDVLEDKIPPLETLQKELQYGNSDLIRVLEICGVAGPFKAVTPWELIDGKGVRRINAGGYSALPFGDHYIPLIDFAVRHLKESAYQGLPQQSASPWRAALEENIIALLSAFAPSHADSRIFFSNSGAEAIETAVKFAKMTRPNASKFINFRSAYHGKTHAALSLTPSEEYQKPFRPLPLNVVTLPYGDIRAFRRAVREQGADKISAVFIEPVQGEAGVIIPPPGFLKELGEICNKHGILICADEIQTGLGRCGEWFASLADGLEPDMMTLAKPLGGGIAAIGVTIARREIFSKMLSGMSCKRHSNTFGGASLAMAIGLKSLEILVDENLPERSKRLGAIGLKRLTELQENFPDLLEAVRGKGLLLALQFRNITPFHIPFVGEMVSELCGALGLRMLHSYLVMANLSLSSKRVVRLTPALNIPDDVFAKLIDRVEIAASKNPDSFAMLKHTPADMLMRLAKFSM